MDLTELVKEARLRLHRDVGVDTYPVSGIHFQRPLAEVRDQRVHIFEVFGPEFVPGKKPPK